MRRFAVLPLFLFPVIAWGDCTEHLQAWAQALHPTLKFDSETAVCKVNPADSSQVLAALPIETNVDEDRQGDYGLEVVVADAVSGKIIAHHYQETAIVSDAVQFKSLALDTARYQIAPGLRAFGVRIGHTGSSRVNPFGSETLRLYVYDGSQLREVLSDLVVSSNGGEWDGMCAGEFHETNRTLAIGKPGKDGFASLRVSEKSTGSRAIVKGDDDCEEIESAPTSATYTLEYDGSRYGVPKELSY
ncbi:PA3715 family protein [Pseudomonas wadenswilerensis]